MIGATQFGHFKKKREAADDADEAKESGPMYSGQPEPKVAKRRPRISLAISCFFREIRGQ